MPPLPDAQDPLVRALADTPRSVYTNYVLPAEQKAVDMGSESKLIPIRVVGALLIHSPSRRACEVVAQDITIAVSDPAVEFENLVELGQTYMDWFICHCELSRRRLTVYLGTIMLLPVEAQCVHVQSNTRAAHTATVLGPLWISQKLIWRESWSIHPKTTWARRRTYVLPSFSTSLDCC